MTVATIQDFYVSRVVRETNDLALLFGCYYTHLPELGNRPMAWSGPAGNTRVAVRYHYERWEDHRRFYAVASVVFDGQPFMLVQNAGREGDDFVRRFVTDLPLYGATLGYLAQLAMHDDPDTEVVSAVAFRTDLLEVYGEQIPAPGGAG